MNEFESIHLRTHVVLIHRTLSSSTIPTRTTVILVMCMVGVLMSYQVLSNDLIPLLHTLTTLVSHLLLHISLQLELESLGVQTIASGKQSHFLK